MNDLTCAKQFTREAAALILTKLEAAETPSDFLAQIDDLSSNPDCLLHRESIDLEKPLSIGRPDSSNAEILFEAVGQIDRDNAAMPGLWTYMAFNTCRQYMNDRWPLDGVRNWKNRVKDRWILPVTPSRGRLIRHGISRLWWASELTYDGSLAHALSKANNDQYAYTKWVFSVENRIIQLFDRSVGENSAVLWAVMDSMQHGDDSGSSDAIADVGRDVLLEMSTRQLGLLSETELMSVVDAICKGVLQSSRKTNGGR